MGVSLNSQARRRARSRADPDRRRSAMMLADEERLRGVYYIVRGQAVVKPAGMRPN